MDFTKDEFGNNISAEEYISLYDDTRLYRDEFLYLLKYSIYIPESYKIIASVLEEICVGVKNKNGYEGEVMRTLLHELFIYVVAYYLKNKDYNALSYILSKTYFVGKYGYSQEKSAFISIKHYWKGFLLFFNKVKYCIGNMPVLR